MHLQNRRQSLSDGDLRQGLHHGSGRQSHLRRLGKDELVGPLTIACKLVLPMPASVSGMQMQDGGNAERYARMILLRRRLSGEPGPTKRWQLEQEEIC